MELQLFPPEDTTINCRKPDGTVITIDAMDLDLIITEIYQEYPFPDSSKQEIPYKEYLPLVCKKFEQHYGFAMSRRSMDLLLEVKTNMLDNVKKNTYLKSEPASSTESNLEQTENS